MGMGGLRDIEAKLPPGFRFYPRDEELVAHYLYKKVVEGSSSDLTLMEVDLHTCEPWMLPDGAKVGGNEWYFYSFRDRKYATGLRANRATTVGYWKATGKDRPIYDSTTYGLIGMRKTLVFYRGRAPSGVKSSWVMHEFRLENPHTPPKEDWVLCRVFHKSRGNPSKFSSGGDASCSSPPNLESSPQNEGSMIELERFDQGLFSSFMHQEDASPSSMLNLMDFQYNFLDLSPMEDHTLSSVVATKSEYKYGFMYDTGLEGRTLNDRGLPQQETVASEEDEKKGFL